MKQYEQITLKISDHSYDSTKILMSSSSFIYPEKASFSWHYCYLRYFTRRDINFS
jgi:hypothetical protein